MVAIENSAGREQRKTPLQKQRNISFLTCQGRSGVPVLAGGLSGRGAVLVMTVAVRVAFLLSLHGGGDLEGGHHAVFHQLPAKSISELNIRSDEKRRSRK